MSSGCSPHLGQSPQCQNSLCYLADGSLERPLRLAIALPQLARIVRSAKKCQSAVSAFITFLESGGAPPAPFGSSLLNSIP